MIAIALLRQFACCTIPMDCPANRHHCYFPKLL